MNRNVIAFLANGSKVDEGFFTNKCILNGGFLDENDKLCLLKFWIDQNANQQKEQSKTVKAKMSKKNKKVQNCESSLIAVGVEDKSSTRNDKQLPLIEGALFIGTNILLRGFAKVGKTFLSIWLAVIGFKKNLIKKACFFSFDDMNGKQTPRFQEGLDGFDYFVFTKEMWNRHLTNEKIKIKNKASCEALFYLENRIALEYNNIRKKLLKDADVLDKTPFKLIAFLDILIEKINEGYDFFVLDSLSKLFNNTNNLPEGYIEALLEIPSEKKVTFVIIHHNSAKGEVYGKASIKGPFDTACNLSKLETPSENGSAILEAKLEGRYSTVPTLFIKREKTESENVVKHSLLNASECSDYVTLNSGTGTLKDAILSYIRNCGEEDCLVSVLFEAVKHLQKRESVFSVKNQLRFLRDEGLIEEVDKPWIKVRVK
jgi:hypothetical protein